MAASFVAEHRNELTAVITVLAAFVIAELVDRMLNRHAHRAAERMVRGELSPAVDTRLRLVRRLVFVTILVIGIALAMAQFPSVKRVATGILASSALLGLVVGFAARQTLANSIAGISLAISQPIRVGDLVTFEEETGEVEDIRLAYTSIRCDDGRRLVVPNERLAQSSIVNHTVVDPRVKVAVDIWLPPDADTDRALSALTHDDVEARIAEITHDGIRLTATTWADTPSARALVASTLRQESLRRLRTDALS
ncbi:MAG TPA: mechanosensitive ion channel domain-containing protein [Thermoleophilaceae bacterium]|nr:mechanosensitive ion channel domain-containing protein [Thermoleophilaceae bacterium]